MSVIPVTKPITWLFSLATKQKLYLEVITDPYKILKNTGLKLLKKLSFSSCAWIFAICRLSFFWAKDTSMLKDYFP